MDSIRCLTQPCALHHHPLWPIQNKRLSQRRLAIFERCPEQNSLKDQSLNVNDIEWIHVRGQRKTKLPVGHPKSFEPRPKPLTIGPTRQ